MLADLGATVIKIERPGTGDDTRGWGPPYFESDEGSLSGYFMSANRGKQSVCIDISLPDGADLVRRLSSNADILVENFKVGDMARRGLDYETLAKINPGLIYCSVTGFGQDGPESHRPGYDFMIQGMSGLMSVTGEPDNHPGGGPMKVGVALADILTGLNGTIAILAALEERRRSGSGQYIDMALLDVMTASLANQASNFLVSGEAPSRLGNAHPNIVPYQTFATADGHIIVAVGNDGQFMRLCSAIDREDLSQDARYVSNSARVENRDGLALEIQVQMSTRSTDEWLAMLEADGVPCGPINTIDRVFADSQVRHRNMQVDIGDMPLVANPIKYSRSEMAYGLPPPHLGQHTEAVLEEVLELGPEEISALRARNVIE
jgi:crotonobetainyl-CoA:carnitine CoA-transferase CaiB-like acyl-CoA transferase